MPVTSKDNSSIDLSKLGFSEVKEDSGDLSHLGFTEVKKKDGGSNLAVGSDGQLKKSTPTTLPSQPVPDFGMKSFADLAKGQQSTTDNPNSTPAQKEIQAQYNVQDIPVFNKQKADYKEKVTKALPDAITNTAKNSLRQKGINPDTNATLLNDEKSKYAIQIAKGDADVGFDKDGKPGLIQKTGFLDSFHDHMMTAIQANKDAREFKNMTVKERVEFANKVPIKEVTPYIGSSPTNLGSLGATAGSAFPTIGLYGAGAMAGGALEMAAPETGGLSNLALKPVMSFVMNAGSAANQKGMQGTLQRYQLIKQHNPTMGDEEAMTKAQSGEDIDRLAGITESALFSKTGDVLGKSATGGILKGMLRSGIDVGAKTAAVEGLRDIGHNIEDVTPKSTGDIAKDMATAFGENAPMGAVLHGFMGVLTGLSKVPQLLKSALKYDVVTKLNPDAVDAEIDKNVIAGAITPEQGDKAKNDLNQFRTVVNKVPPNLSEDAKAAATGLIIKRDNIVKGTEGLDKSAQGLVTKQTDAIDAQLNDIYRTDKPLEHEINESTGEPYKKPTFDNVAKQRVEDLADKISKGKRIEEPEDLQTEHNFPDELDKQLNRITKEEKSGNKDKENPNTELSDNIEKYRNDKEKNAVQEGSSVYLKEKNGKQSTDQNIISEGTRSVRGNEEKEKPNYSDEDTKRRVETSVSWLKAIEGNNREAERNIAKELIRKPNSKEGQVRDILGYNDRGGEEVRTSGSNGENVGTETFKKGTRTSQEQGQLGQQGGESSTSNTFGTHDTSHERTDAGTKGEVRQLSETERRSVVNEVQSLSDLSENGQRTRSARNLQKMLDENSQSKEKTNEIIDLITQNINKEGSLQISSPSSILQHPQETTGETGSGRTGMESGIEGNEPPKEGETTGEGEEAPISTKQRINLEKAKEFNLPEVPIPKLGSDAEEVGAAKERIDTGKSNPKEIVSELLNDKPIGDKKISVNDRFDMQYYMLQLKQRSTELSKSISDAEAELAKDPTNKEAQGNLSMAIQASANHADDYIQAIEANKIGSAIWGKSGNAMQVELDEQGNILQRVQRIKDWYGNDVPEIIKKSLDKVQSDLDKANAKINDLQEKYNKLSIESEALKIQKETAKKTKKTSTDFKEERKSIVDDIRNALKKARGQTSVAVVPYANELIAITPHVLKLFKSYAEEGFNKVEEVVDKIQKDLKEHMPLISKAEVRGILAGEYKQPKKPIERNVEYRKATQSKANAMFMLRHLEKVAMNSKKNIYMKGLDFATRWERTAIFAFNTSVFLKLQTAALYGSFVHKPLEMGAGKIASKAFPRIAKNAPIEGNENLQSLGKFYGEFINPVKFAKEAVKIYTKGESQLTQELSKKHAGTNQYVYKNPAKEVGIYNKGKAALQYLRPILEIYTNTHAVIKDPVKRATFESGMINILNWYKKQGIDDVTHPLILESARQYAYKRAEYEIFQENNKLSGKINGFFNELEKSGIIQSKLPGVGNTITGNAKYTAAALYHFFVPISTVAINLTRRLGLGIALPYNIAKAIDMERGINELDPEKADLILRQLKKGAVGAAYWTLGFYLHEKAGGIWNRYDPDKNKGNRLHSDKMDVGGLDVPKALQHTTQLQALQYGATARNVFEHYKNDLGKSDADAYEASIGATLSGLLDGIPPAKEAVKLAKGIEDPHELKGVEKDIKRSVGIDKMQDLGIIDKDETPTGMGGGASGKFSPKHHH